MPILVSTKKNSTLFDVLEEKIKKKKHSNVRGFFLLSLGTFRFVGGIVDHRI